MIKNLWIRSESGHLEDKVDKDPLQSVERTMEVQYLMVAAVEMVGPFSFMHLEG